MDVPFWLAFSSGFGLQTKPNLDDGPKHSFLRIFRMGRILIQVQFLCLAEFIKNDKKPLLGKLLYQIKLTFLDLFTCLWDDLFEVFKSRIGFIYETRFPSGQW